MTATRLNLQHHKLWIRSALRRVEAAAVRQLSGWRHMLPRKCRDEDTSVLQRTSTIAAGRGDCDGPKASPGFRIKNTFVHIDDESSLDIGRSNSAGLPSRTKSDPSGQKLPLPGSPKMTSGVSTVLEESSDSEFSPSAEDDEYTDSLERLETYDHFALGAPCPSPGSGACPPPAAAYPLPGQAVGMQAPFLLMPAAAFFPQQYPCLLHMVAGETGKDQTASVSSGPRFGASHRFHREIKGFGVASPDFRQFTKGEDYEGRLSVLSAAEVQKEGVASYLMQFSGGELSKADGVGFVFASRTPCAKNIQKIVSVFVNQSGRICMRMFGDVFKAKKHVRPLRIGDWIEMVIDLERQIAIFRVWPPDPAASEPDSSAEFHYWKRIAQVKQTSDLHVNLNAGHFACVVQNVGVTVTMGS